MTKTYDQRCYDLAGIFLGDEPGVAEWPAEKFGKMKHELALTIQEAIEDWLESKRLRAAQAEINGNWIADVFKPLPEEEAKLLREYGP